MNNPMLEMARQEGHRPGLPASRRAPRALPNGCVAILRLGARMGGVRRSGDLPRLSGLSTTQIGNFVTALTARGLIDIKGPMRGQFIYATRSGKEVLAALDGRG